MPEFLDKKSFPLHEGNGVIHDRYGKGEIVEILGDYCQILFGDDIQARKFHRFELNECEKIMCYEPAIYSGSGAA